MPSNRHRLLRVLQVAIAMLGSTLASVAPTCAQNLVHQYEFNGGLNDAVGTIPLVNNGGTLNPTSLSFGNNQGPTLNAEAGLAGNYSIAIRSTFSDDNGYYKKVIDFKDRTSDFGQYSAGFELAFLNFYPYLTGPTPFNPLATIDVVFTRNGTSGVYTMYLNGVSQGSFIDSGGDAIASVVGSAAIFHFFRDDFQTGEGEAATGAVDEIRIWDGPLTAAQVLTAFLPPCTLPVVTVNPAPVIVSENSAASFSAGASGSPAPSVKWQVSTGGPFSDLAGETGTSLSFTAAASQGGNQYRAVFTNACGSATSEVATLTVKFTVTGRVSASCPAAGTGLLGVTVDAFDGSGYLLGNDVTDATGAYTIADLPGGSSYTITVVTPLGYAAAVPEVQVSSGAAPVDFALSCVSATGTPKSMGFWKHNVGVATGGKGAAQVSATALCSYLDLIAAHFNSNALNQVVVYQPPASDVCADKLQVARILLDLQGNVGMIVRARQQLTSLLLNVAAGNISQTKVVSADGATVSQAITYCDNVIDSPTGNYERAKTIADLINNGQQVGAGMIPLSTQQIAYAKGLALRTFRVMSNAGGGVPTFQFTLGRAGSVRLDVFDVSGRLVTSLANGPMSSGSHTMSWRGVNGGGTSVGRGIYFARLETADGSKTLKVVQLKH